MWQYRLSTGHYVNDYSSPDPRSSGVFSALRCVKELVAERTADYGVTMEGWPVCPKGYR